MLDTESDTYLLDRVMEGIRMQSVISTEEYANKYAINIFTASKVENPRSHQVANWAELTARREYSLLSNNCLHFGREFGSYFGFDSYFFYKLSYQEFVEYVRRRASQTA